MSVPGGCACGSVIRGPWDACEVVLQAGYAWWEHGALLVPHPPATPGRGPLSVLRRTGTHTHSVSHSLSVLIRRGAKGSLAQPPHRCPLAEHTYSFLSFCLAPGQPRGGSWLPSIDSWHCHLHAYRHCHLHATVGTATCMPTDVTRRWRRCPLLCVPLSLSPIVVMRPRPMVPWSMAPCPIICDRSLSRSRRPPQR